MGGGTTEASEWLEVGAPANLLTMQLLQLTLGMGPPCTQGMGHWGIANKVLELLLPLSYKEVFRAEVERGTFSLKLTHCFSRKDCRVCVFKKVKLLKCSGLGGRSFLLYRNL